MEKRKEKIVYYQCIGKENYEKTQQNKNRNGQMG